MSEATVSASPKHSCSKATSTRDRMQCPWAWLTPSALPATASKRRPNWPASGRYGIVDVNAEVFEKYGWRAQLVHAPQNELAAHDGDAAAESRSGRDGEAPEDQYGPPLMGALGQEQVNPLSNLPIEIGQPNIYYLYAGYGH